jgi:acyl phosphate:glycerol-3-phosphate acyltransferase
LTTYAIIAAVSYLLGSIPFGYILVRLFLKQDIRQTGSGNIGATNVARSGAKGLAIATLLLDALKGFAAVAVGYSFTHNYLTYIGSAVSRPSTVSAPDLPSDAVLGAAIAALFAIAGHCFPVWLKFKGGKGVATAAGAFIAFTPKAVLVALVVFLFVVAIFRYVSLGSISAAAVFPIAVYWLLSEGRTTGILIIISLSSLLIILKHHANIRRLLAGTENRLGAKPKIPPPQQMEKQA